MEVPCGRNRRLRVPYKKTLMFDFGRKDGVEMSNKWATKICVCNVADFCRAQLC